MLVTYSWRLRQACQQHKVWLVHLLLSKLCSSTASPTDIVNMPALDSNSWSLLSCNTLVRSMHHDRHTHTLDAFACHGKDALKNGDAHRQAKRWRGTVLFLVELAVQWLNLVFYIMPNVYLLLHRCEFLVEIFKWCGWLSWTCWNTVTNSACNFLASPCNALPLMSPPSFFLLYFRFYSLL